MTDRIMMIVTIVVLAGFLGILFVEVLRVDLGAVIGVTFLLVLWDLISTPRTPPR